MEWIARSCARHSSSKVRTIDRATTVSNSLAGALGCLTVGAAGRTLDSAVRKATGRAPPSWFSGEWDVLKRRVLDLYGRVCVEPRWYMSACRSGPLTPYSGPDRLRSESPSAVFSFARTAMPTGRCLPVAVMPACGFVPAGNAAALDSYVQMITSTMFDAATRKKLGRNRRRGSVHDAAQGCRCRRCRSKTADVLTYTLGSSCIRVDFQVVCPRTAGLRQGNSWA